jgi:hypothetical protein
MHAEHEPRPAVLRVSDLPDLLHATPVKNPDAAGSAPQATLHNSAVRKVRLADEEYALFVQPFHISLRDAKLGTTDLDWSLVALTNAARLHRESMTISYTVLLIIVFVFLLIMLSWPFLKLWYLGPRDRLGRSDVRFLSVSALLVSGLVTLFVADACAYPRVEHVLDGHLEQLADRVDGNVRLELLDALKEARTHTAAVHPSENQVKQSWNLSFDRVAWVSKGGEQTSKWTSQEQNTAFINVKTRAYFTDLASEGGLRWNVSGEPVRFWVGTILSRTTGERQALLSLPWTHAPPITGPGQAIVTFVLRAISLRAPVLPPSFGFAVIASNGDILFHSDRAHEGENIFVETDGSAALRAAVAGRASDSLNAPYLGVGHRLFVKPLAGLPWSIVAFRSKELLRTLNLEALSTAFAMFLMYGLLVLSPVAILLGRDLDWCWPDRKRNREYRHFMGFFGAVIFAMTIGIVLGRPTSIVFMAVLVPLFVYG